MKCPICGHLMPPNTERCPDCGYRVHSTGTYAAPRTETGYYTPPNQTKRSRGCCCALILLVPLLLGIVAAAIGTIRYVLDDFSLEDFGSSIFEESPQPEPDRDPLTDLLPNAAQDECFSIRNGVLTFLPDRWDGGRVLRVPSTVQGETVRVIAPGCFRNCSELTTIILPDTVTDIELEAFAGCTELRGLYLPTGTERIGPRAFAGCINLQSVYVPASVVEIAPGCFDDCAALLYLFYEGDFDAWNELYSAYINPFTTAICLDGSYYHGSEG